MTSLVKLFGILVIASAMSFAATIDNFNGLLEPQVVTDYSINGVAVSNTIGTRTIFANMGGGGSGLSLDSSVGASANDFFSGSASVTVSGTTGATYEDLWNLTGAQGLAIEVVHNDLPGSTIAFWISDGTHKATSGQYALPVIDDLDPSQTIIAMLGGFSGIGSVNLSAVTSLGFINTHVVNGDLSLDNFATYVPEPGTYVMMAAGLLGLYSIRRKRV